MKQYSIVLVMTFLSIGIQNNSRAEGVSNSFYAHALLRYEDETQLTNQADRERLRLIARAGIKSNWSPKWTSVIGVSTGLKNKQNVPAITIARLSQQPQPDNDVFIERAFIQFKTPNTQLRVGKQPWNLYNITDIFWDRNLYPIGVSLKQEISQNHKFSVAALMPLDGQSQTIGQLYLAQYHATKTVNKVTFNIAPWIAFYNGQRDAEFATRDTEFDHKSLRLSSAVKFEDWQIGVDTGLSVDNPRNRNDNFAITTELRYGKLKKVGNWLAQISYSHVEKYSVIREFGQNARAAKLTTNFSGWDARLRHKLNKDTWIGVRLSRLTSLKGPVTKSNRFRIEARRSF